MSESVDWFSALLGRLYENGDPRPTRGGLNFVGFRVSVSQYGYDLEPIVPEPVEELLEKADEILALDDRVTALEEATLPVASTTTQGIVELATLAEVLAGTDAERAVTPSTLAGLVAIETRRGLVELATPTEAQLGVDNARAVTPAALAAVTATSSRRGLVELATQAEVNAGTDTERAVTPASLVAPVSAYSRMHDRFLGQDINAPIGDCHWRWTASGGTATASFEGVSGRDGVFRLDTGANNGNAARLYHSGTVGSVSPARVVYMSWLVALSHATDIAVRLGLATTTTASPGANGLYFWFDPASSTAWRAVLRAESSDAYITAGATVAASTYYWLEMFREGDDIRFAINGVTIGAALATGLPDTPLIPGAFVQTNTNAVRSIYMDEFDCVWARPQRWT